jgi:hypothetical protein
MAGAAGLRRTPGLVPGAGRSEGVP